MRCDTGKALLNEWKQKRDAKQDTADIRKKIREHNDYCAACTIAALNAMSVAVEMAMDDTAEKPKRVTGLGAFEDSDVLSGKRFKERRQR